MRLLRTLRVLVGVAALAAAVTLAFSPDLLPIPQEGPVISTIFTVNLFVNVGLGVLLGLVAFASVVLGRSANRRSTPTPERVATPDTDVAGATVDRRLGRVAEGRDPVGSDENAVKADVRDTAISVLMHDENLSESEARDRLADGTWTDEPRARWFLGDDVPRPPWRQRFRDWLSAEPSFTRWTRATVRELESRTESRGGRRDE